MRSIRGRLTAMIMRGGRPLRFLVAGGVNTFFGIGIYPLLMWTVAPFHRHYLVALAVAQATSLVFAYLVYKLGVFRTRANLVREFGAFSAFYLINYAANWIMLPLLVEAAHIPPVIAQLCFSVVLIIGSYFWHSHLTFKTRRAS